MAKKALLGVVVAFLIFYLISQPQDAAGGAKTILSGAAWAFNGVVTFFRSLA